MPDDLARRQWDALDDLEAAIQRAVTETEQPGVRATLPDETPFRCIIDYRGAYAYWDLPSDAVDDTHRDLKVVEDCADSDPELPVIDRENDPPIAGVWS